MPWSHLKLGCNSLPRTCPQKTAQTGHYKFDSNERLGVYLTNSLEQTTERETINYLGPLRVITEEATAATEIKRGPSHHGCVGKPPYSDIRPMPAAKKAKLTWIGELIEDYKIVNGKPLVNAIRSGCRMTM